MRSFTLTEYPNLDYLTNFITHPDIYPEHLERLINYINICKKDSCVEVTYTKEEFGRFFVNDTSFISCCNMWNKIRSTLFGDSDSDIDIVNAHSEILLGLMKKYSLDSEYLKMYCDDRDSIISGIYISEDFITLYNQTKKDNKTKKDIIKSLFTIILYGGSVLTWENTFKLTGSDYKLTSFVKRFVTELNEGVHTLVKKSEFKPIYEFSRDKQINKAKEKYKKKFKEDLFIINHFKVLSLILQEHESNVIYKCIMWCQNREIIVTSYNYDGFQICKSQDVTDILLNLNNFIKNEYPNFNIKFIHKPFKPGLNVNEFVYLESDRYSRDEMNKCSIYSVQKEYFERFHFKVLNPYCFIRDDTAGIFFIKPSCLSAYSDINTDAPYKEKPFFGFISEWTHDRSIRYYDSVNYYPDQNDCPEWIYNMWKPFPILKIPSKSVDTSFIHNFIRTVIGNTEVVEYIYNWFAHILQFPSRKTEVCLLLFGNQGCGKSSIAEYLMREILGADKMLITSKVDKAFGRFVNTQGKLLAVLNEANGKETFNISDILKDAITCGQTEQEKKGIDAVSVIDYTNYIFTTNNLNSVKIPKDDRRFMPITLNDTYLKNAPFFDKLYSLFNDKEVMRTFYDELMSRDIKLFNPSRDRIETEIMIDMKSMNMDPVEQFIDYWRNNLEFHMERKMRSSDLYLKFRHFWEEDGRKSMDIPTSIKFSVRLKQFSNYIRHYKQSNWYFELLE